jgi:hypothetical protein
MSKTAALAIVLAFFLVSTITVEDAWAKGGGGGARGGGGVGSRSSTPGSSKSSGSPTVKQSDASPRSVGSASNPYYGQSGYGYYHSSPSNFFLWFFLFHSVGDDDDDLSNGRGDSEYMYSYGGEPNYSIGGWVILSLIAGCIVLAGWFIYRKSRSSPVGLTSLDNQVDNSPGKQPET